MSEAEAKAGNASRPAAWISIGVLLLVVGALVGGVADDVGWFVLFAAVGGPLLTIGLVGKGVEVGIRAARH